MKKLTLILVALLLAVTCVLVACGKKNETPVDNTDPKPVDDTPTPAPVETVTVEDMTTVAEQFKKDFADNYVDLYSKDVENAIDVEKAAALLKIMGASSKEKAQDIADEFIAFLKSQPNAYEALKALVEKIGDVALADEALVEDAKEYKALLEGAYAGSNEAKKALLDKFKADKALQKAVKEAAARIDELKAAKDAADVEKTGLNAQIADLYKDFTAEKKTFKLKDVNAYEALVAKINAAAKAKHIEVGSDAYNEIYDVKTLADAKAVLDAAVAADQLLLDMKAVVDAAAALEAAAEDARYKEYCFVIEGYATEYDTEEAAKKAAEDAKLEDAVIKEVERAATQATKDYKLTLKADIEAAQKVLAKLKTNYSAAKLKDYGYKADGDVVKAAEDKIEEIGGKEGLYAKSLKRAQDNFANFTTVLYVDVAPKKAATTDIYTGFDSNPADKDYLTKLAAEIKDLKATFKTVNAKGITVSYPEGLVNEGKYTAGEYKFNLVNGKAAVTYTAWTYSYKLDGEALGAVEAFDALKVLSTKDEDAEKATAALKWLKMYIGEGDYADKYDLKKDYGFTADLIMVDRAIEEVATAATTKINGKDVTTDKTAAVEAKVYSPYTVAKMLVAEQEKIVAAKEEAEETIKAAALALRTAGDANAIKAARDLYDAIANGSYLNEKLYGVDKANEYLEVALGDVKVAVREKTDKDDGTVKVDDLLKNAKSALDAVMALKAADLADVEAAYGKVADAQKLVVEIEKLIALYDEYLAKAAAERDAAVAANAHSKYLVTDDAVKAAKATYNTVEQLRNLLVDYDVFAEAIKDTDLVVAKGKANIDSNKTAIKAVIDQFAPAGDDEELVKAKENLADFLAYLAAQVEVNVTEDTASPVYGKTYNTQIDLDAALAKATKDFEKEFDEFHGYADVDAAAAYGDKAAIKAALAAIDTFATNNKADFINLAYTATFGDKVITFADPLTEVYRERMLAGNYDVIEAAVKYAESISAAAKAALDTETYDESGLTWKVAAQNRVNAKAVVLEAVTSIKAAKEVVKNYALDDDIYELDMVLKLINGKLAEDKQIKDIAALKTGIAANLFNWTVVAV